METLTEVAPLATWIRVSVAAVLLLAGATVLSHILVHVQAYGHDWRGIAAPGPAARLARLGSALVLAGVAVWGWDLGWSVGLLAIPALGAAAALALEARAGS